MNNNTTRLPAYAILSASLLLLIWTVAAEQKAQADRAGPLYGCGTGYQFYQGRLWYYSAVCQNFYYVSPTGKVGAVTEVWQEVYYWYQTLAGTWVYAGHGPNTLIFNCPYLNYNYYQQCASF